MATKPKEKPRAIYKANNVNTGLKLTPLSP
jgi:hypothetical protein